MMRRLTTGLAGLAIVASASGALAEDDAELATKLSNPIASMISVPFQFNYDDEIGPERDGQRLQLNFQPVVPIGLGADWTMISRTILPVIDQDDIFPGAGSQFGLGDITQSLFFSPTPAPGGVIWGAGPVFLVPTGTDELLSAEKWGAGPTAVVLKQSNGWTIGILANHIWSFAGADDRDDVSTTFLQPFLSYTTPDAWTFGINTESTYDWENDAWSVPINLTASKLVRFGNQPVSLGGGLRYWADSTDGGPHGFGARAIVTFLFPE